MATMVTRAVPTLTSWEKNDDSWHTKHEIAIRISHCFVRVIESIVGDAGGLRTTVSAIFSGNLASSSERIESFPNKVPTESSVRSKIRAKNAPIPSKGYPLRNARSCLDRQADFQKNPAVILVEDRLPGDHQVKETKRPLIFGELRDPTRIRRSYLGCLRNLCIENNVVRAGK